MPEKEHKLPSGVGDDALALLLQDLPEERPIPTYNNLTYPDFLTNHLLPNTPFVLSPQSTSDWPSRTLWSSPSPSGPSRPNLSALRHFATHQVPVADTLQREYSEFVRSTRPLGDVLDEWERGEGGGLYVKDWHLMAELEKVGKGVGEVYTVPECFREDWLNPPYTPSPRCLPIPNKAGSNPNPDQSDFKFTYLGPRGTFTPLHRDVYASYSWSANIVGRKLWWLFPPDELGPLQIDGEEGGGMAFDVRDVNGEVGGTKVVQEEGEIIFVPSGWYHQVLNLDFCISINHNFIAPLTLPRVYTALQDNQSKVEASISDVKAMIIERHRMSYRQQLLKGKSHRSTVGQQADLMLREVEDWEREWTEEVQKLLEMDAGWNWTGFWDCIRRNVESPPAGTELSMPISIRDETIRSVIERYRSTREWKVLDHVRLIVQEIEDMIGFPSVVQAD